MAKTKFKELPGFWKKTIAALTLTGVLFAAALAVYMWYSVGELIMVMF